MIQFLNHWGSRWLEAASWAVVQNTAYLGLVFLFLQFLKKRPGEGEVPGGNDRPGQMPDSSIHGSPIPASRSNTFLRSYAPGAILG